MDAGHYPVGKLDAQEKIFSKLIYRMDCAMQYLAVSSYCLCRDILEIRSSLEPGASSNAIRVANFHAI